MQIKRRKRIVNTVNRECHLVKQYINKNKEDKLLKYCLPTEEHEQFKDISKQKLKATIEESHEEEWKSKPLHGKYFRKVEKLEIADYSWLKLANLKKETEALIMAAQENSLHN
jgi:hypothetical protein